MCTKTRLDLRFLFVFDMACPCEWRHVTWCDVMWRDVTWRDVMWCMAICASSVSVVKSHSHEWVISHMCVCVSCYTHTPVECTYTNESNHTFVWINHSTCTRESCVARHVTHIHERVTSHTYKNESRHTHTRMSHITHIHEWVTSHTYTNKSRHAHIQRRHITFMRESHTHTYKHTQTRTHTQTHTYISHLFLEVMSHIYEWVMSHIRVVSNIWRNVITQLRWGVVQSTHMHTHTCTHAHTCTHTHTHTRTRTRTHKHTHTHTRNQAHKHTHLNAQTRTRMLTHTFTLAHSQERTHARTRTTTKKCCLYRSCHTYKWSVS